MNVLMVFIIFSFLKVFIAYLMVVIASCILNLFQHLCCYCIVFVMIVVLLFMCVNDCVVHMSLNVLMCVCLGVVFVSIAPDLVPRANRWIWTSHVIQPPQHVCARPFSAG